MKKRREDEGSSEQEPLTIHFGDIHTYSENSRRKYVIIDVGDENDCFTASQLLHGGRLGFPGTGSRSDIGEIVGSMSLDKILKGLGKTFGGDMSDFERMLQENSRKSSKIIS